MTDILRIVVYGSPGPQGSKKFVGIAKSTGHAVLLEMSKKVRPWRQDVKAAAEAVRRGRPPLDAPLVVSMVFTLPKPASAPKTKRSWPMRYPDVSKLARSTEDALTAAGIWKDDARVVEYTRLAKVFPGEDRQSLEAPGVIIEIAVIEEWKSGGKGTTPPTTTSFAPAGGRRIAGAFHRCTRNKHAKTNAHPVRRVQGSGSPVRLGCDNQTMEVQ